ncbi:MAG: isoprenylcysteine carboxylmethyltransferase family protein [Armatimonadota bacterium]
MKSEQGRSWAWVLAQWVLLAALLCLPGGPAVAFLLPLRLPAYFFQGVGLLLVAAAALNLGNALTPLPSPRQGAALKTGGLYRSMRHPIYTGILVWALGFAVASSGSWHLFVFTLLCLFFSGKARYEEALLRERFPEYGTYAERTPRFIPRLDAGKDTR